MDSNHHTSMPGSTTAEPDNSAPVGNEPRGPAAAPPDAPGLPALPHTHGRDLAVACLHTWLIEHLDVRVPMEPIIDGHSAPIDYLCHSFYEGRQLQTLPPASPPYSPPPPDCIVWANRGGGKTFLGAVATALDLYCKPGIQIRILGGSLEQSQRMHAHLVNLFRIPFLEEQVAGKITERRIRLINGSCVEVLAQSQASVRGTRVQKIRCDEVELFDPRVWEAAQLATRSAVCGQWLVRGAIECLSTMHVPHGIMAGLVDEARAGRRVLFKWGVVDALDHCPDERKCSEPGAPPCPLLVECQGKAKKRENAAGHLGIDDAITMKARVAAPVWESEMLCLRPRRTESVFPEFDPAVHVVTGLPSGGPDAQRGFTWIAGMDFGFRSPTVVLWGALDREDRLYIADERIVSGATVGEHIDAILAAPHPPLEWIGIDPAGEQRSQQSGVSNKKLLERAGLAPRVCRLKLHPGLCRVRARLRPASGPARLLVHHRCAGLIEALERSHYDASRPGSLDPVKDGPDHAVDALRYLIANLDPAYGVKTGSYTHS